MQRALTIAILAIPMFLGLGAGSARSCPIVLPVPATSSDVQCFAYADQTRCAAPISEAQCTTFQNIAANDGLLTTDALLWLRQIDYCPIVADLGDGPEIFAICGGVIAGKCADGTQEQTFSGGMVGCAGAATFANRDALCAPGSRTVSAAEWTMLRGGIAPTHDYWTNNDLKFGGSGPSACFASAEVGTSCGTTPMRVCTAAGTDAEGNQCNWQHCGLDANSPDQFFGGCAGNTTAGALCIVGGCADGSIEQKFPGGMVGCAGGVAFADRAALCGPGYRVATAAEWAALRNGIPATHDYWTNDPLKYSGSGPSSCFVSTTAGTDCGTTPMRVCTAAGTDAEGNQCNWQHCGLDANSPDQFFGGCVGNTSAGALCVPNTGCADGSVEQVFANGMVGCAGAVTFANRDSLCAPGYQPATSAQWAFNRGPSVPTHDYWTNDALKYNGSGPSACFVSTTAGSDCGATPMRVCTAAGTDAEGNACNWQHCGIDANAPDQFFGGCVGNTTAGTVCTPAQSTPPNIAFVTSTTQNANYGGLAGADNLCQTRAVSAGLSGTFRAWLATGTVSANSRLGGASGWVRPDGRPIANTTADLANGKMFYPIRVTELMSDALESTVNTATTVDGTRSPFFTTCGDYTVADGSQIDSGLSSGEGLQFTGIQSTTCASANRLYCFGVDRQATVAAIPAPSYRRAFLTHTSWTPGGGIAAADTLCLTEASAAGLPGTYKALLATTTATAASRFNTSGPPWGRIDGVLLSPTASALFASAYWDSALMVLADGTYTGGNWGVWGGASGVTALGTPALTCNNWTSTTGTGGSGRNGMTRVSSFFGFDNTFGMASCNATFLRLACFQE